MTKRRLSLVAVILGLAVMAGLRCGTDTVTGPDPTDDGVVPPGATVEVSSSQKFETTLDGMSSGVSWWVDGILGGSPEAGMITQEGLYIAPPEVTESGSVTIMAKATGDTLIQASAIVKIRKSSETAYVEISPVYTAVAIFDSVQFEYSASGCSASDPTWTMQVISGSSTDIGTIDAGGTYFPPRFPSGDFELLITAKSDGCADKTGIARVIVKMPEQFYVELEDFTDSFGIGILKGIGCSGGVGITGLEEPEEWITIPFRVPAGGRYMAYIRYAAGTSDRLDLTVTVEDGPYGMPTTSFILDEGSGLGG